MRNTDILRYSFFSFWSAAFLFFMAASPVSTHNATNDATNDVLGQRPN